MNRELFNKNQRERRADLKARGICVDCQFEPVDPAEEGKPAHVCCRTCLEARRTRFKASVPAPFSMGRLL
jgi:hypothetical protein